MYSNTKKKRSLLLWLLVCAGTAAFVLVLPKVNAGYNMLVLNMALIYSMVALSISVMLGMGGQMTFAGVSMMGLGGYFVANASTGRLGFQISPLAAFLLAPVFTALVALLIGSLLLRLRGTYFTFSTIGLVQVAFSFYSMNKPLFGGYDGISGIPRFSIFGFEPSTYNEWFYVIAAVLVVLALLVERVRRSKLGRSLAAIRDNEMAAKTLGVNVYATKVIAFSIAGAICGIAGALYALHNKYISADMFAFEVGVQYIIMAMLGGVNNTLGCIVGAIIVGMLPEWLRVLKNYMQLIYGVGVILLMIFMPMGLSGLVSSAVRRWRKKRKNQLAPPSDAEPQNAVPGEEV